MKTLFKYEELVILQNEENGEVFVVSLVGSIGKVEKLNEDFVTNDEIIGAITKVMWNLLGCNNDIQEYIEEYKKSDLYKYTKEYEQRYFED